MVNVGVRGLYYIPLYGTIVVSYYSIIIIIITRFLQGIYNYTLKKNLVSRV
jgi:hypothetical protein